MVQKEKISAHLIKEYKGGHGDIFQLSKSDFFFLFIRLLKSFNEKRSH